MKEFTHIAVTEPSIIIRSGMLSVLKSLAIPNVEIAEFSEISVIVTRLRKYVPDILILNPANMGMYSLSQLKNEFPQHTKFVALQIAISDIQTLKNYDEVISIYDSAEVIKDKLQKLITNPEENTEVRQELSEREKEILVCVVKGMTNKQIADTLFLSVNTVMSHRRNIASKLQIKSTAGLTIYAILNKLVEINEVNIN